MSAQANKQYQSSTELVERLMEEERQAIEAYKQRGLHLEDPKLESLIKQLADTRIRCYLELEMQYNELKAQAEVTGQINAMFS